MLSGPTTYFKGETTRPNVPPRRSEAQQASSHKGSVTLTLVTPENPAAGKMRAQVLARCSWSPGRQLACSCSKHHMESHGGWGSCQGGTVTPPSSVTSAKRPEQVAGQSLHLGFYHFLIKIQ